MEDVLSRDGREAQFALCASLLGWCCFDGGHGVGDSGVAQVLGILFKDSFNCD
jgi:hypothetical protein